MPKDRVHKRAPGRPRLPHCRGTTSIPCLRDSNLFIQLNTREQDPPCNPCQPLGYDAFPWLQPNARDRHSPPLSGVHAFYIRPLRTSQTMKSLLRYGVVLVATYFAAWTAAYAGMFVSRGDGMDFTYFLEYFRLASVAVVHLAFQHHRILATGRFGGIFLRRCERRRTEAR